MSSITTGKYADAMPELGDDEYEALKRSIAEHGLEYPILVDRNKTVIDGHHRLKACRELGIEPEVIVIDTEHDPERAYRPNLARRDFSSGAKRRAVKQYLLEHYDGERSEREIASDLGVSQYTVNQAISELRDDGKLNEENQFPTEQKRQMVRRYIEAHPSASNRKVADAVECDVSYRTVSNWRSEWEDEESDQKPLRGFASDPEQADTVAGLYERKEQGDEVADAAKEQAEAVSKGDSSPNTADRKLRREERKKQQKKQEQSAREKVDFSEINATITDDQSAVRCDAVITDPPYGILEQDWEPPELKRFTGQWLKRWSGSDADFIASFWSQEWLYEGREWFDENLNGYEYRQTLIWHVPNNKKHSDRSGFKRTWEPILFYRREDTDKQVSLPAGEWGGDIKDFDHHTAAVPQENFNEEDRRVHPAQKPLSVMEWLIATLSAPGDLVADPFCGSGTTGVAATKHGRAFHGIETDPEYRSIAEERIAAYGQD